MHVYMLKFGVVEHTQSPHSEVAIILLIHNTSNLEVAPFGLVPI